MILRALNLFLVCMVWYAGSYAQQNPFLMLQKMKQANEGANIMYDYRIRLINTRTNSVEDSICGKLYKNKANYLDSNNVSISAAANGFYCKVDFKGQSLVAYNLDALQKQLGSKLSGEDAHLISISDSMIMKYGKITIDKNSKGNFIASVDFKEQRLSRVVFEIEPLKYRIQSIQIETVERDRYDEPTGYKKLHDIYNVKYAIHPTILDLQRFFKVSDGKIVASDKYKKYKLHTLTN